MKLLKYILSSLTNFKLNMFLQMLCIFIIAVNSTIIPYIIKLLIDYSSQMNLNTFEKLGVLFVFLQFLNVVLDSIFDWLGTLFHTKYREQTVHNFFNRLSSYEFQFFQDHQVGSLTAKISDAFNMIPPLIFITLKTFFSFVVFMMAASVALYSVSVYFTLVAIIFVIVFLYLANIFYYKYEPLNSSFAKVRPKIYGFLSDYFSNFLTVKFFNNQEFEKNNLKKLTQEFIHKSAICGAFLRNYYAIHGCVVVIYMIIILAILRNLSFNNNITTGDFALVFMVNYKLIDLLLTLGNQSRDFVINYGIVNSAIELLEYNKIKKIPRELIKAEITNGEIEFKNVSFKYSENAKIFDNLSVKIHTKEKVGLVGYSGSGKSTFINLLLGLYNHSSGKILIDGYNIDLIAEENLNKSIAVVEQEPRLFHRTIADNIRYGKISASDEEVVNAAKKAQAHDFIVNTQNGYDSFVGERGIKLSGGQRQRIALARAILKNSAIFIFDEATSQLDSVTENCIQESILEIISNRTSIMVAHRLSTLTNVDRIFVFDNRKIVEMGTLDELLNKKSVFYTLWNTQLNGFLPSQKQSKDQ